MAIPLLARIAVGSVGGSNSSKSLDVKIGLDSKRLEADLKRLQKSLPAKIDRTLIQTAQFGTDVILDRTKKGVGYSGAFKAYTPEYVKRKGQGWASTGKTIGFGGAPTSPVNLSLRGEMLGAMASAKVKSGVAKIYFTRSTEAKKAAFNNKTRPFFGFNALEPDRLRKFFFKRIKV
jgi:hypothetical protein